MAVTARNREAGGTAFREPGDHQRTLEAGPGTGTCGKRPARKGARQSAPQKPFPVAANLPDRGRSQTRERTGLAEHIYTDEKLGGIADRKIGRGIADCPGATCNR